jgi:1,4-alpha-glucan branching enzyme
MNYMKEKLGAWQVSGGEQCGKVRFKVFFPKEANGLQHNIKHIQVTGSFQEQIGQGNDWSPGTAPHLTRTPHPEGEIWSYETPIELPSDFYEYKYYVTYNDAAEKPRWVSDPCTRYGGSENMNAAFVIGGSQPAQNVIAPLGGGRKHLRDLVIYEMMIDDFTIEYRGIRAPLDAICDKLDYLQGLGVNAILFMPWTAWNNEQFNWGYTPALYFSVGYRYANDLGQPAEKISWLKKLISECHKRGMHVIIDGVFNHVYSGFPYKRFYQEYDQDCPYTGPFHGEFAGLQDLDFGHTCTQEFIRDVCYYWMETFKIDGIRFDNTVNFYQKGDNRGLPKLMEDIDERLAALGEEHFSMTLEHLQMDAVEVTLNTGATSYWDNALYGECFHALWEGQIRPGLYNALNNNRYLEGSGKVPTIYIGNHDHSHVTWRAGARTNEGSAKWFRTRPYVIALLTSPGAPLIQNGQEFAQDHWMLENDQGSGRRVQLRPLHWSYPGDKFGRPLVELYTKLTGLRRTYAALRSDEFTPDYWEEWQTQFNPQGLGVDTAKQLLIYWRGGDDEDGNRQQFVIVLNFSDSNQWVSVPFPEDGHWTDLLSDPRWHLTVHNRRHGFTIGSNWGHVFYKGQILGE